MTTSVRYVGRTFGNAFAPLVVVELAIDLYVGAAEADSLPDLEKLYANVDVLVNASTLTAMACSRRMALWLQFQSRDDLGRCHDDQFRDALGNFS